MRRFLLVLSALYLTFSGLSQQQCNETVRGLVRDLETDLPLPYATIKIEDTELGAIADKNGAFEISNLCESEIHLEVSFLGYKTVTHHHDKHHPSPVIYLAPDQLELESVVIETSRAGEIESLAIQKQDITMLSTLSSSLGELSNEITGVSLLSTGANITKPIIHGLHSNRVLVINDDLRHGYQSWGQEHAPEIDPSHVDQIEVVKGAGTVKYGPEALGGVILYNSKKPLFDQSFGGSFGSSYQTNGRAFSSQLSLGQGSHRFAWNMGAFGVYQGDLETRDYILSNTGKREYGASFGTFLHRPLFDFRLSGSYFQQELGILRGSIVGNLVDLQNGIDRSIPNPTFPYTYDLSNPRQETKHALIRSDFSIFLNDHILNLKYGIQQNLRKEFDIRRGENNERPIIDLELISHTIETEWIQPTKGQWNGSTGIQFYSQNNDNKPGTNTINFVPYYDIFNIGLYTVQSLTSEKTTYEVGLRFDHQSLSATDTVRETTIYTGDIDYSNVTFTLGVRKQINEGLSLFSNLGTAWRPPNVAELYAFGYHHSLVQFGLWRYEVFPENDSISTSRVQNESDFRVPSERSIKWVSGVELKTARTTAEFVLYANQIKDYIFLRPYGVTIQIAGTFPYFLYDQTDAFFVGSDWDIRFSHSGDLTSEVKLSYIHAFESKNQQALLEIPPLNINYTLNHKRGSWNYGLNLNYTATQWNAPPVIDPIEFQTNEVEIDRNVIFDFMSPPSDYFLLGGEVNYQTDRWSGEFKIHNILNSTYRVYTDRLRYYADAPGRNFSLSLKYTF